MFGMQLFLIDIVGLWPVMCVHVSWLEHVCIQTLPGKEQILYTPSHASVTCHRVQSGSVGSRHSVGSIYYVHSSYTIE